MQDQLGQHADKWLNLIITYRDDPSKFELPELVFYLPENASVQIGDLKERATNYWSNIDPSSTKPHDNLAEQMPFWAVFTLPRRPSLVYFSIWLKSLERKDKNLYNEAMYRFQNLIQNYMRENLLLFNLVKPFRNILGLSARAVKNPTLDEETLKTLEKYSTPQKVISAIDLFAENKPLKLALTYILLLERLSVLLKRADSSEEIKSVVSNFNSNLEKIQKVKRKPRKEIKDKPEIIEVQPVETTNKIRKPADEIVEFDRIELQEYDGYVQISGYSNNENRNFRIYNCKEEDDLREEIWKERRYPIRRLVGELLQNRYSSSKKLYKLKWGVDIDILEPNWLS